MATNFVQKGDVIDLVAAAAWTVGVTYVVGVNLVVPLKTLASGATGACAIEGVFELPAAAAAVIAAGEIVIWDVSEGEFDDNAATPASGDVTGGAIAVEACAADDTTVRVKLLPGNGTVT